MIELLFHLGFSLACGVGATALVLWAMDALPDLWQRWQRWRKRKQLQI